MPELSGSADFPGLAVVNYVAAEDHDRLLVRLGQAGFRAVLLEGGGVRGAADLFGALVEQGIAEGAVTNWAGFKDSLEAAFARTETPHAIVWTGADRMLDGALADLVAALGILTDLSRRLYADGKILVTFLEGEGANFPRLA